MPTPAYPKEDLMEMEGFVNDNHFHFFLIVLAVMIIISISK